MGPCKGGIWAACSRRNPLRLYAVHYQAERFLLIQTPDGIYPIWKIARSHSLKMSVEAKPTAPSSGERCRAAPPTWARGRGHQLPEYTGIAKYVTPPRRSGMRRRRENWRGRAHAANDRAASPWAFLSDGGTWSAGGGSRDSHPS